VPPGWAFHSVGLWPAGTSDGSYGTTIVTGKAKVTPWGKNWYTLPALVTGSTGAPVASCVTEIAMLLSSALAGTLTDAPSARATVPPAGPMPVEVAEPDPESEPEQPTRNAVTHSRQSHERPSLKNGKWRMKVCLERCI